ncbi:MAG: hypothetical protein IIA83_05455, partial [Thaumarchaeota archaeon]|nr:hypothetical protein [Nitrososphaerota archaeon]
FPNNDRIFTESIRLDDGLIEHVFGDMRRFDHKLLVKKMVKDAKEQIEYGKKLQTSSTKQEKPTEYQKGFGTYFFPPIVIGTIPKPSISNRLYGAKNTGFSIFKRKSFVVKFSGTPVIINNDGYFGVAINNKARSLEILNTIMAVSELENLEAHAVSEHELSKIDYDPQTLNITGFSYSYNTARNELFRETGREKILEYQIKEIAEERIKGIMEKTLKIFEYDETSKAIRDFGDMLAHMRDSEFPQAFIKGWTIIEKHISQKWNDEIYSEQIYNKKKYSKWSPSADDMLKDLKAKLSSQHYETFMTMKGIRNKHLHEGEQITKRQAQDCMDVAKEIILKKYHANLPR